MPPGVSGFVGIAWHSQRSVAERVLPLAAQCSENAPVVAATELVQSFAAAKEACAAGGGRLLRAEPPENGGLQRPREGLLSPAPASRAFQPSWHRPWPFAPCAIGPGLPVARPLSGSVPESERWEPESVRELRALPPMPLAACAAGAGFERELLPGDGLAGCKLVRTPRDLPGLEPLEVELGLVGSVVVVVDAAVVVADTFLVAVPPQ